MLDDIRVQGERQSQPCQVAEVDDPRRRHPGQSKRPALSLSGGLPCAVEAACPSAGQVNDGLNDAESAARQAKTDAPDGVLVTAGGQHGGDGFEGGGAQAGLPYNQAGVESVWASRPRRVSTICWARLPPRPGRAARTSGGAVLTFTRPLTNWPEPVVAAVRRSRTAGSSAAPTPESIVSPTWRLPEAALVA